MRELLPFLLVVFLPGCGLLVDIHLVIATTFLGALSQPEPEQSMFPMHEINERSSGPLFVLLFLLTLAAVFGVDVISDLVLDPVVRWWLVVGAVLYVIGPFGLTMTQNSPRNQNPNDADWSNAHRV